MFEVDKKRPCCDTWSFVRSSWSIWQVCVRAPLCPQVRGFFAGIQSVLPPLALAWRLASFCCPFSEPSKGLVCEERLKCQAKSQLSSPWHRFLNAWKVQFWEKSAPHLLYHNPSCFHWTLKTSFLHHQGGFVFRLVCWLVGRFPGTYFHKTCWGDGTEGKKYPITFWGRSRIFNIVRLGIYFWHFHRFSRE